MVGREAERAELDAALARCRGGAGGVVLVSGEAGVGKSRLVADALCAWPSRVFRGTAVPGCRSYEPLSGAVLVLREELGEPGAQPDPPPLGDWLAGALRRLARREPVVLVLEDLHVADAATVDLLPPLSAMAGGEPLLVVATYRSDQLSRRHPLRRTRAELRRAGAVTEVPLRPLDRDETRQLLAELCEAPASAELVDAVYRRAEGLPFFVEELIEGLEEVEGLVHRDGRVGLAENARLSVPESVTDAVLARTAELRESAGEAVELAAVLGVRVHLPTLAALVSPEAVDDLLDAGLLVEEEDSGDGELAAFRHALVQEALYRAVPWARRRSHHGRVAARLAEQGWDPEAVADHWIAAHEESRARPLLLMAAQRSCLLYAYRDAARLVGRALEIWPEHVDSGDRTETLERLAGCAELCGEHQAASDAWSEVVRLRQSAGEVAAVAAAHRRLATALEMLGDLPRSPAAREAAAAEFAAVGQRLDAVEERLVLAEHLSSAAHNTRALEHAVAATADADSLGRADLRARALAMEGDIRAAMGEGAKGVEMARQGLALALEGQLFESAGEAYYHLASALLFATDYADAADAYGSAFELCQTHEISDLAHGCSACLAVVLRLKGDWDRALATAAEVLAVEGPPEPVRMIAQEELGLIWALRGDVRRARGPLRRAASFGRAHGIFGVEVGAIWGLAAVAHLDDDPAAASEGISTLLARCDGKEERHFALPALRWASTYLAEHGDTERAERCHRLLATAATQDSSPKVLSALAHAGAELLWAGGDAAQAVSQFQRSVELLGGIAAPYDSALSRLRWGTALAAVGERQAGAETVADAYQSARQLGAQPLVRSCVVQLAAMGDRVDQRLGRVAARALEPAGLTRREKQVLRLLGDGLTNRQIAAELFLSPRTVDMHVRNVFTKLGCSSRLAAVQRGVELGIIAAPRTAKVRQ
jgi:DNA-binding CsgD family transcriptional regulator/tetratricopeptide (TPR) repeat protein